MSIHQQNTIALLTCCLNVCVLLLFVVGIEIDEIPVLVCLSVLNQRAVFLERKVLAINVFQQCKVLRTVIELVLREHSVVDENLQVVPLLLVVLAVVLED